MGKDEDTRVDATTENALLKWKDEILKGVKEEIKESISNLNNHITQVFDIRMKNAEENISSLRTQSAEHYAEMKAEKQDNLIAHGDILKEVDVKISKLRDEVVGLDRRQSVDEGIARGTESANNDSFNRKNILIAVIGLIVAIAAFLGGIAL